MHREGYQPDSISGRQSVLTEYKTKLQPVVNGAQPRIVFLYGKTGVGKTAVSRYLLDQLQRDTVQYEDVDPSVFWLNCTNLSSSYQVAVNLVNTIRNDNDQISTTEYPQQRVFDILYEELDTVGGKVLLVFDEIDHIGTDDEILCEIPRARQNNELSSAKPGVIGISNDFAFRDDLSPKVKDTLCEEEIHFSLYNAPELEEILRRRAQARCTTTRPDPELIRCVLRGRPRTPEVPARRWICCTRPGRQRARTTSSGSSRATCTPLARNWNRVSLSRGSVN